jgi:hypothetical protein
MVPTVAMLYDYANAICRSVGRHLKRIDDGAVCDYGKLARNSNKNPTLSIRLLPNDNVGISTGFLAPIRKCA